MFPRNQFCLFLIYTTIDTSTKLIYDTKMFGIGLFILLIFLISDENIVCDADSDCFYVPKDSLISVHPALIVLNCTGATAEDLDSVLYIADSLDIVLSTCHKSMNHRSVYLNDEDIMRTYEKLIREYPVDVSRIFLYGFSGMAAQALITLFWHTPQFRGVIAVCGHKGAMQFAEWQELSDKYVYLISREKDWNLGDNRLMHSQFRYSTIKDTLIITQGEHTPTSKEELLDACIWLLKKTEH